jgi:hypothetical protein
LLLATGIRGRRVIGTGGEMDLGYFAGGNDVALDVRFPVS